MRYALLTENSTVATVHSDGTLLPLAAALGDLAPRSCLDALCDATLADRVLSLPTSVWERFGLPADTPLLAPLPRPNRILAIGRNYAEHAKELGNAVPDEPVVFLKASTTVLAPNAPIVIPEWVGRVDYEAELLVVLGTGGKNIAEADAMAHVVGYTAFNDVTAREKSKALQAKGHPWFLAKSLDTFGPMGPVVVTPDEIPNPHDIGIQLRVNDEIKQDGRTDTMIHTIPQLIAYLSRWLTLETGDVIATGTPPGVGPIVPGDVVAVTVEGIGTLKNSVTNGSIRASE